MSALQTAPPTTAPSEWKRGARTVVSAAIGYGTGPLLVGTTSSIFIRPVMEATGWSTTEVLVAPFLSLGFAFLGPVAGRLADRFGLKRVLAAGLIPYAVVLLILSMVEMTQPVYYALNALIGIFGGLVFIVPWTRAIAGWFDKSAGKAFGLLGVGGAGIPVLAIPVVSWAIYTWGFQAGYVVLACFALVISLPAALIGIQVRNDPSLSAEAAETDSLPNIPSSSLGQALRSPYFWAFSGTIFISYAAVSGFAANMQPIFLDSGLDVAVATVITSLVVMGVAAGRMLAGVFLDRGRPYVVASVFCLAGVLGAVILVGAASLPVAAIVIGAFLVSMTQGAEADFTSYFMLKRFGPANFGTIFAFAFMAAALGGLVGSYAFAFIRDATGSYAGASAIGAGLYLVGSMLFLGFHARFRKEGSVRAEAAPAPTPST